MADNRRYDKSLTWEECVEWREKYAGKPWAMLALATAAAGDPSPLQVMTSLYQLVIDARAR